MRINLSGETRAAKGNFLVNREKTMNFGLNFILISIPDKCGKLTKLFREMQMSDIQQGMGEAVSKIYRT